MIRLVIEDTDVDVLQTETIVGEYAIAPIGDISKRVGAKSIQFKLPKTTTNKRLFESSELASSYSSIPYKRLKCRIYVDGVDMQMLFCILESVDEYYNIRMFGLSADFFNNLKDKKLADLDLRWLNHHWSIEEVDRFTDIALPLKYPAIDYNIDSPNDAINDTTKYIYTGCLYPVVEEHFLIEECCTQNGYTLDNKTKDAPMFAENIPVIPLGSRKWESDNLIDRFLGKFNLNFFVIIGGGGSAQWYGRDVITQPERYWVESPPNENLNFGGAFILPVSVRLQFTVSAFISSSSAIDEYLYIDIYHTPLGVAVLLETLTYVIPPSGLQIDFTKEVICRYFYSGFNRFYLEARGGVDLGPEIGFPNTLEITKIWKIRGDADITRDIQYKAPYLKSPFDYITVASNLPDFSQADFIKAYLQKTNSLCYVDERQKTVLIAPFEIIKNDLTNAVDWSGKVDYKDSEIVTFDLGYAQNNYLKYKEDSDVIKPTGTDKNFQLNDNTLENEKTIVTLIYPATESVSRLGGILVPKINSFENYLVKKEFKPRCLLMKYGTGELVYKKNKSNQTGAIQIFSDIPYCHFILDSEEFNYGFGNSLFNEFWAYIIGIIDKAKVINVPMQLSTLDIINFDFLKAVYIKELDSYFYVSKIKFDYTSRKSSIVELIKLL